MKRLMGYALALALVASGCPAVTHTARAQSFQISFNFFFGRLSPYGRWVYVPRYGQVWYPVGVRPYWQPYTNGYWAYTEYGWTWVPYDPFGWITFHYGAWTWFSPYGWVWVPGYVWAPAWVTWRYGPSYIGWAPLPPDYGFSYGAACPPVTVIERAWVFVPVASITRYDIPAVRVPPGRNAEFLEDTQAITNFDVVKNHVVNPGPRKDWIERTGKIKVQQVNVERLGIKPEPIGDLTPSRQVTITTPYKSRSVMEPSGDSPRDRAMDRGKVGDQGFEPKRGQSSDSGGEEKFNPRRQDAVQEGWPEPMDRPRKDTGTRSEKPSSDPGFTQPDSRWGPTQKSVDRPKTWPNTREADRPSYKTTPPRTYETQPPRYPSRPERVKPDPSFRQKSSGNPSGYPDRAGSPEKTPRHVFQPQIKSAPDRPAGPMGYPSPRPGAPVKQGKR